MDTGKQLFASAARGQISLGVCMIDIDHFKMVNDTYGHEAGDKVLKHISAMIKNSFRETDIVSRFGGEEFCILWVNMKKREQQKIWNCSGIKLQMKRLNMARIQSR